MSSYSIGADSPRWWWLPAATGVAGVAAIAAILVLPVDGASSPERVIPHHVPPPAGDLPFTRIDPGVGPPCFRRLPRTDQSLDQPRCGRAAPREQWSSIHVRRRGLDTGP